MELGIDLTIDCVFKKIFGSEENKELLLELINGILEEGHEEKVVELEILNPYNIKDFLTDKLSIVDIKAKDSKGESFIIEIQMHVAQYFPKRILYYWARNYQNQLKQGERYDLLRKTTIISISKEPLPVKTQEYFNHYKLKNIKEEAILCDDLNIYTIELKHFLKNEDDLKKSIECWTYLMKNSGKIDVDNIPSSLNSPSIKKAIEELTMFTKDEQARALYESRRMALMDHVSLLYSEREQGRAQGIKIGMEKGIEKTAKKLMQMGLEIEQISKATGLSKEILERLN